MDRIIDIHVHSKYARATSKDMNLSSLYKWGHIKGIEVIGTGDFTHPAWFAEIQNKLEPAENGLFKLKKTLAASEKQAIPASCLKKEMRFVLSVEIATIYRRGGKLRKVHSVVVVPDIVAAQKVIAQLQKRGNLSVDGRPVLGMDSIELLKIVLDAHQDALFVPAHIWTPWFGLLGSKSGFDSIEDAFGEYTPYIKAAETGLSADPALSWQLSALQNISMISNSDAHSPTKLGREATVVHCALNYQDIVGAIKTGDERMVGTIEFFPEEGKYYFDGHRACGVRLSPEETNKLGGTCPICSKPLTIGVDNRIRQLADKQRGAKPKNAKRIEYIVPLSELIAEAYGLKSTTSRKVIDTYTKMCSTLGTEFEIVRVVPTTNIQRAGFPLIAEAVQRVRDGAVIREPGYDGVYGKIGVFDRKKKRSSDVGQLGLL